MRIAAIYWPTSSVGGINTELRAIHAEAKRRGDTFHVLCSAPQKSKRPCVFDERKIVRGGDTFITIDGELPHHPDNVNASAQFLNDNYDRVYLAYLCPHPNKAYGDKPLFLELLRNCVLPIIGRITDGYWESYAEWGSATLALCEAATCVHMPALPTINSQTPLMVRYAGQPFEPREDDGRKPSSSLTTVWTSQWKAIKGIHRLLPEIHRIEGKVDLYSCGILYYQLRTTPAWEKSVGRDLFKGFNGGGRATYHGNIPLEHIPSVLARAWFMIDLMGIGNPRNKIYKQGAVNNTTIEALYYGACPILHNQARKFVPENLALFVEDAAEVPALINNKYRQKFALCNARRNKARSWVLQNFMVHKFYDKAVIGRKEKP